MSEVFQGELLMSSSDIEYLESERKKLWKAVVELQEEVKKKTSDYEAEAKQASKKCAEYKNKCDLAKNDSNHHLEDIKKVSKEILESNVTNQIHEIRTFYELLLSNKTALENHAAELEQLFANYSTYADKLKKLDDLANSADESSTKIDAIYKQLVAKKKEIDELHVEVFGYIETDSATGEKIEVKGLKDELDATYTELKSDFEAFSVNKNREFDDTINGWRKEYSSVLKNVEDLLPRALTTGLSFAYSDKKDAEVKESQALEQVFKTYVKGLIGISLIPFIFTAYMVMFKGMQLEESILKMPRLVFAILPLYIPVLWVAYSANRKINLSKRLIEEYTHKEVLSKTFEGLSKQIENIKDSEVSNELRTRLLYNILEVSSENPGKLISDYNKSDHPLMDALDKSVKLTNAIEHLAKVPGMAKLISVLENKSKAALEKEEKKAVTGIEKVEA